LNVITSYKTIASPSEGTFKEKGSKFLAFAYPARDEREIREHLQELRKKFHDARHHCYAWRLGPGGTHFRANDDQEPSGTAGKPILGQLQSFGVTDVLVVVVRYFGGTLLGTGGLIQAYKEAAREALSHSTIIEKDVMKKITIHFSYSEMNEVMKIIRDNHASIIAQDLQLNCVIECELPLNLSGTAIEKLERIQNIKIN
jgi:uncharacterized YigZ family protein